MPKVLECLTAVSISIVLLLSQAGCALHTPHPYQLPPPLSEEERARLGMIGIVSADFVPETKFFAHARGRVKGATEGMAFEAGTAPTFFPFPVPGGSSAPGAGGAGVYAAVFLLGLLAVGVAIAEVERAATAIPAEKVKDTESNLKKALIELKMQESLGNRFFQTAREQSVFNFVPIEEKRPKTTNEILNYRHFKEKGIDTVIELSVLSIGFEGAGGKDPLLTLLIDSRTRVLSVSDGAILYENMLEYRSAKRTFSEWISTEGKLFSEEIDKGYGTLTDKIVEELFLRYEFAPKKE
jgi:hypothetical protein